MRPRLSVSRSAVELIKGFEGFRARAARLDDGRWTVGYGHTLTAREGATISETDAEALLMYDLIAVAHAINEHVYTPLNQNEFDALASFVFNIGVRAFRGSPTLRRLNEGRPLEAALAMELWRKSDLEGERIVIDALVRRRAAEKALFLKPVGGWTPAPTPVLPPKLDYDALGLVPLQSPVSTRAELEGERAFIERAPEASLFAADEEPSASEAAAAAVIDRLGSILPETPALPEPKTEEAPPPPSEAAPAFLTSHERPQPEMFAPQRVRGVQIEVTGRPTSNTLAIALLAVLGVALFAAAALWGFRPAAEPVFGVAPRSAGLIAGSLGVIVIAAAAYLLLDRLGGPRDRA